MPPVDISHAPIVIYVAIGLAVLVMVASAFPKVLGPISKSLSDFAAKRRTTAGEIEDAETADLRAQVGYLRGVARERFDEINSRDELNVTHAKWDRAVRLLLDSIDHDLDPGEAPPLWPPRTTTDPEGDK